MRQQRGWLVSLSWSWKGHFLSLSQAAGALQSLCGGLQRSTEQGGPCAGIWGAMQQGLWKGYGQSEVARSQRNQVLGLCLGRAPPGVLTLVRTSPAPAGNPLISPAVSLQHPLLRKLSIMLTLEEKCLVFQRASMKGCIIYAFSTDRQHICNSYITPPQGGKVHSCHDHNRYGFKSQSHHLPTV